MGILNHFIELIKGFPKVSKINFHLNNAILIIYSEEDICCNSPFLPEIDFIQKMFGEGNVYSALKLAIKSILEI